MSRARLASFFAAGCERSTTWATWSKGTPFLYVVCAAGIAADVSKLITAAQERDGARGWG
ncbi:hypothetical protein [Streptomyces dysideae]|uniref:hypothetical protein n=1 Tax=Streptomyces dysideae TaxID=909626 RepID=UPI000AA82318|nr:hypothetical protein [Streptomyces dysideae]